MIQLTLHADDESNLKVIAVDVGFKLPHIHYRLIVCYRPPGYSISDMRYFNKFVSHSHRHCSSDCTDLLTGDFNFLNMSWSYIPIIVKHDSFHSVFLDFVSQYGFSQTVVDSTRSKNNLDLVLVNDLLGVHIILTQNNMSLQNVRRFFSKSFSVQTVLSSVII